MFVILDIFDLLFFYFIFVFFFNDTATTEIYTLSLHDALPISYVIRSIWNISPAWCACAMTADRKSTRLNSTHSQISYAVFCLKKKKEKQYHDGHAEKTVKVAHKIENRD